MSQLRKLVEAGDVEGCIALLEALTPKERKELRALAVQLNTEAHGGAHHDGKRRGRGRPEQRDAAATAVMGTSSTTDIRQGGWPFPSDPAIELDALRRLQPSWLADAGAILLELSPFQWVRARRLIRAGLSSKPDNEWYILGLTGSGVHGWGQYPTIRDLLDDDPGLLEDEIWRLFEVEGGGELSLAVHDKYSPGGGWAGALKDLSDAGTIPRARLLDASLDALERDFAQFRAGWFSRFHEHMAPTIDERVARQGRYMRLLASPIPPTLTFALKALAHVDKAERLDDELLLRNVDSALLARAKSTVKAALKLLNKVAKRNAKRNAEVATTIAGALAHDAVDVQKAVFDQLDRLATPGNDQIAAALAPFADGVQPSLRNRLAAWVGAGPAAIEPLSEAPPPPLLARLDESRRVAPIADADELIAQFSYVLENADQILAIERVFDGVSRMTADAELTKPLLKRAKKIAEDQMGDIVRLQLARLAIGWVTREASEAATYGRESELTLGLQQRITAMLKRIAAGTPLQLLSTPTHRGYWIEPLALVERVADGQRRDAIDQVIALLRLAPEAREVALKRAAELASERDSELGRALRHALGEPGMEVGPTAALWIAAARARAPYDDDPAVIAKHPGLGPDAGEAASYGWQYVHTVGEHHEYDDLVVDIRPSVPDEIPPAHISVALAKPTKKRRGSAEPTVRYAVTLWPARRDGFFAVGARILSLNLDWSTAAWHNRAYLEPLCDPYTPMNDVAMLLLAMGLAAKEPGEKGLAIDAMIAAVSEGRLDPAALGDVMAGLLASGEIKAARWAATLSEVAAVSARHAAAARVAILRALRGDPDKLPRDIGKLLGVLHELLVVAAEPHGDEQARDFLTALKRSGKAGKLAKKIAAMT